MLINAKAIKEGQKEGWISYVDLEAIIITAPDSDWPGVQKHTAAGWFLVLLFGQAGFLMWGKTLDPIKEKKNEQAQGTEKG